MTKRLGSRRLWGSTMRTVPARILVVLVITVLNSWNATTTSSAEVTYESVGGYVVTDGTYQSDIHPNNGGGWFDDNWPCIDPAPGLGIFGATGSLNPVIRGDVSGTVQGLGVVVDGVRLEGNTLPSASYFTSGLSPRRIGFCSLADCGPWPYCRFDWTIGSQTGSWNDTTGWAQFFLITPAKETAGGLPFSFSFCAEHMMWAAGCNYVGSSAQRWILHAPDAIRANQFGPGDTAAYTFPGTGILLDFQDSPGGAVGATSVAGMPPFSPPPAEIMPRYWEISGEMSVSEVLVDIVIAYNPVEIPAGIQEPDLRLWQYSSRCEGWELLPALIASGSHVVSAAGLQDLGVFMLGGTTGMPIGSPEIVVNDSAVTWKPLPGATSYDVVRGDLGLLISTGGNFTLATSECIGNDVTETSLSYSADPGSGEGFWILVRGSNGLGDGTYDSSCGQRGLRDLEINASLSSCP